MLDKPHSPLDVLRAHRAAVAGRIARLTGERDRLRSAEDAEREAVAALAELGRQEIAAARAWAASGASSSAPAVDAAERVRLTAAVVEAEAASAAARGAGVGIDAELDDARREMADLGRQIEDAALDHVLFQFGTLQQEIAADGAALRTKIAGALGLVESVRAVAERHEDQGRHERAMKTHWRLQPLYNRLTLDLGPTQGEVAAQVAEWTSLLTDLGR